MNGDIIFAKITPCMENGKLAIVDNLKNGVGFGSTEFHVLRVRNQGVSKKFLFYLLAQRSFRKDARMRMTGSAGQLRVPARFIETAPLLLPPSNEQYRIVGKVEELFSFLDTGVASLRAVQAQLKRYRQAVLKAAFEGKLTEQWRQAHKDLVEPANLLFEKIKNERIKRGLKQWTASNKISIENLAKMPENWMWVFAQEVCENITNGYTPKASELNKPNVKIPFVKIYNLTFNGELDFSKKPTFISKEIHEKALKRSKVLPGDVLINIVGPPLGKVSIVPQTHPEWNINQAIVFFRPLEGYNNEFLALCLQTDSIMRYLTNQAQATAGQFNISVNMSRNLPIPLAPKEEQSVIVSEIKKHFTAIEEAKLNLTKSVIQAVYLRNSILSAAFLGKLVPQDPTDEPAERLLERIKSKRPSNKTKNSNQVELSQYVK